MTHVVYNTDKGSNTKSGYVKYEGSPITVITIPKPSTSGVSTISYGESGKERDLTAYKIGNGNNSLVMVCEVHGYEDNFPKDGLELVNIGNDLIRSLTSNGTKGWSVYVIPAANPDGLAEGYTNNGPGRCTIVGGVDINRDFPIGFTSHGTPRYWTGDAPLSVNESKKLSEFIQGIKNKTSGKMVVIDLHGWEGAAIGNPEIGQYFRNQFGFEQRSGYGADRGFLIAWAKSIGADAALIELPKNTHSHSDVINGGYSQKVINAVNGMLSNNPGSGSIGKWIQKGDNWYYYENDLMVTGWKSINGSWYYLESSGAMAIGWLRLGDSKYYLNSSGQMLTGSQVIDGVNYTFDSSGVLVLSNMPEEELNRYGQVINVTSNLNVRSDASTSATIIGSLKGGEFVSIAGRKGEWYKIYYDNGFGYISKDYVEILVKPIEVGTKILGEAARNVMDVFKIRFDDFKCGHKYYYNFGPIILKYEFGLSPKLKIGEGNVVFPVKEGKIREAELILDNLNLALTREKLSSSLETQIINLITSQVNKMLNNLGAAIIDGSIETKFNPITKNIEVEISKQLQPPYQDTKLYINLEIQIKDMSEILEPVLEGAKQSAPTIAIVALTIVAASLVISSLGGVASVVAAVTSLLKVIIYNIGKITS
nr:SH3 domain-containing protein [Clostridium algidicarnis]